MNNTFVGDFDGRQYVGVALVIRVQAAVVDAALARVAARGGTRPEDLLGAVAVAPVAVLSQIELERNAQRVKLNIMMIT